MKKSEKKKWFARTWKYVKWPLLGVASLHVGTQLIYWGNNLVHSFFPSQQRQAFEKAYGFPIVGWSDDIEDNGRYFAQISQTVAKEKQEMDFTLDSLFIDDGNYLKKSFTAQVGSIFCAPYSGYCFADDIVIKERQEADTLHQKP